MDPVLAVAIIAGTVSLGGTFLAASLAFIGAWFFTRGDRQRIATAEARIDSLWTAREADAIIKRAQGDHIDILEAHIWAGSPPPPPPRPEGV